MGFLDDAFEDEESGLEGTEYEYLEEHFDEHVIDITDSVEEYDNGKTIECPCGAGIGVKMDEIATKCYSCMERVLIDLYAEERPLQDEETTVPETSEEDEQSGLSQWV